MVPSTESAPPFVELAAKTNYSFLEGASFPEEMVEAAQRLGYGALGIADTNGVYGVVRAHVAAKARGLPLLVGADVPLERPPSRLPVPKDREGPEEPRLVLLATSREGYGNLCELLTEAHAATTHDDRTRPRVTVEQIAERSRDLVCLLPAWRIDETALPTLREAFGPRLHLLASRFRDGTDRLCLATAAGYAERLELPVVASNRPLFHVPRRKPLQDVLACLRHNCTLRAGGLRLQGNAERYLKSRAQLQALYHAFPAWLEGTVRIAGECRFSLDEIRYRYPIEWIPPGETGDSYLAKLVDKGVHTRYGDQVPEKVRELVRHELALIGELGYSDYFLTIWDIVAFARREGILCQGRGSAANSIVCYLLDITAIDPSKLDLLFERFVSRERCEPPDIDIDFEHERREEVIQYLYRRYGRHRAAITAEVICFRRRSSLREAARVFELPVSVVTRLQTLLHRRPFKEVKGEEFLAAVPEIPVRQFRQYLAAARALEGFPRHLGTHVGGFVLSQERLVRNVPVEKAAMVDRTIVQWDKNDLDALGFVRVDILGLGILTALRKSFDYCRETYGKTVDLTTMPADDPAVYERVCRADTVGVFQIESRAQMNMLPRLRPRCFYDLVVEISLVRPGPIQGDMVHPYLRRRMGEEPIHYAHPAMKAILEKTCGVPLFQEQIMKIAMVVAGFSGGEADALRRAMGTWRRDGGNRLAPMGEKFRRGLEANGVSADYAERIFRQIEGFAEYGFPESHAASFAVLVYATAWLKHHYPDAFLAGLLNAQPMGFYGTHSLVHDGLRHGIAVEAVDVNRSRWDNRLLGPMRLLLGLREVKGFRVRTGEALEEARVAGPFRSLVDFVARVKETLQPVPLTKRDLFLLAGADAFAPVGLPRREALWEIQGLPLVDSWDLSPQEKALELPRESGWERITQDHEAVGVSLFMHPMAWLRRELEAQGMVSSETIRKAREGQRVEAAGIVICRQMPPTASGVLFLTLEDEHGFLNLVVWNPIFQKHREPLLTQSLLRVTGKVQRAKGAEVIHVIVETARGLRDGARVPSHDFR